MTPTPESRSCPLGAPAPGSGVTCVKGGVGTTLTWKAVHDLVAPGPQVQGGWDEGPGALPEPHQSHSGDGGQGLQPRVVEGVGGVAGRGGRDLQGRGRVRTWGAQRRWPPAAGFRGPPRDPPGVQRATGPHLCHRVLRDSGEIGGRESEAAVSPGIIGVQVHGHLLPPAAAVTQVQAVDAHEPVGAGHDADHEGHLGAECSAGAPELPARLPACPTALSPASAWSGPRAPRTSARCRWARRGRKTRRARSAAAPLPPPSPASAPRPRPSPRTRAAHCSRTGPSSTGCSPSCVRPLRGAAASLGERHPGDAAWTLNPAPRVGGTGTTCLSEGHPWTPSAPHPRTLLCDPAPPWS